MNMFIDIVYKDEDNTSPPSSAFKNNKKDDSSSHSSKNKKQKKVSRDKRKKTYHWKDREHQKYILFLSSHGNLLSETISDKRKIRPHVMMSKVVKTKTPRQCRTHHQKMMMKHKSVSGILRFFTSTKDDQQQKISPIKSPKTIQEEEPQGLNQSVTQQRLELHENPFECNQVFQDFSSQNVFFEREYDDWLSFE